MIKCSQFSLLEKAFHLNFERCLYWVLNSSSTYVFSFSTSKVLFYYGLDCKFSDKKSVGIPLFVIRLFLWLILRIFSSLLAFRNLIMIALVWLPLCLTLLKFPNILNTLVNSFPKILKTFIYYFFQCLFCTFLFSSFDLCVRLLEAFQQYSMT